MKTYAKLVRDNIPDIIAANGQIAEIHVADEQEYRLKLDEKLREEIEEFIQTHDLDELADILEVVRAQADLIGGMAEIERHREIKLNERGGFTKRIILDRS